jgi:hypothetical protein
VTHLNAAIKSKRLFILLIATTLFWIFTLLWRAGWASVNYFQVQHWLYQWNTNSTNLTETQFQAAQQAMEKVLALEPEHPHYLLMMAKVQEWGWYKGYLQSEQIVAVESYYQDAIKLRPAWAVAYADYAWYLSSVQFRVTDAFTQLTLAKKFGPYLDDVQQRTLAVAFSRWSYLTVQQKAFAYQTLHQTISSHQSLYSKTLELVRTYKMQRLGCIYLRPKLEQASPLVTQRIQRDFCRNNTAKI